MLVHLNIDIDRNTKTKGGLTYWRVLGLWSHKTSWKFRPFLEQGGKNRGGKQGGKNWGGKNQWGKQGGRWVDPSDIFPPTWTSGGNATIRSNSKLVQTKVIRSAALHFCSNLRGGDAWRTWTWMRQKKTWTWRDLQCNYRKRTWSAASNAVQFNMLTWKQTAFTALQDG